MPEARRRGRTPLETELVNLLSASTLRHVEELYQPVNLVPAITSSHPTFCLTTPQQPRRRISPAFHPFLSTALRARDPESRYHGY